MQTHSSPFPASLQLDLAGFLLSGRLSSDYKSTGYALAARIKRHAEGRAPSTRKLG
jgi:hypothetical protein